MYRELNEYEYEIYDISRYESKVTSWPGTNDEKYKYYKF